MLELENLTKDYDGFLALDDLSLTIPPGEFFCFLGPNGAGKTTTIKIITGLLRPARGRAVICGRDIQQEPMEAKRNIGYIPDTPYLYEKLSGRDFMYFVGSLYNVPKRDTEAAMEKYFTLFQINHAADHLIENYSFGMRQKLCFSAAFMHNPRVLVVDEPMVGLDPQSARTLKNILRGFCAEGGTVFLSTHLLAIAEELCDRLGIITKGKLRFLGTVNELRKSLAREGNLEDLFLELTADGVADQQASPLEIRGAGK
ncbi:ABC transporter ATP-binding protein [Candidatus Sumerlaeota bacterium]|nr:ABC transporter ATP-binding protein [Candidatus Sumerlaeota bacterium]